MAGITPEGGSAVHSSDEALFGGSFPAGFRLVHFTTGVMFIVLLLTGFILYLGPVEAAIGNRALLESIHIYAGIGVLAPYVLSLVVTAGESTTGGASATRILYRRLSRWTDADRRWLSSPKVGQNEIGSFNGGQKLNANILLALLALMLLTGLIMGSYFSLGVSYRTGSTFVHDVVAFILLGLFLGHVTLALRHPSSMRAMFGRRSGGHLRRQSSAVQR